MMQLNYRLKQLQSIGIENENNRIASLAIYFREKLKSYPFELCTPFMANGVTAMSPTNSQDALKIIKDFENLYDIVLTPSGGELAHKLIRISHMGAMDESYVDVLLKGLKNYYG